MLLLLGFVIHYHSSRLERNKYTPEEFSLKDQLSGITQESPMRWILVCVLVMMLHSINVLILYYICPIIHAIVKFWPKSVKQVPNRGLGCSQKWLGHLVLCKGCWFYSVWMCYVCNNSRIATTAAKSQNFMVLELPSV